MIPELVTTMGIAMVMVTAIVMAMLTVMLAMMTMMNCYGCPLPAYIREVRSWSQDHSKHAERLSCENRMTECCTEAF